jgi:hypothetical protein
MIYTSDSFEPFSLRPNAQSFSSCPHARSLSFIDVDVRTRQYFADWFDRVDKTQAEQPHWITPLATTTPRLEEEYRYDQLWQTNAKGITTDNYEGGKGLELIPCEKVEVIFNVASVH